MAAFLAPVLSAALPALAGGAVSKLMGGQNTGKGFARKQYKQQRKDYLADVSRERAAAEKQLAADRAYAAKMLQEDRNYARRLTAEDRAYFERAMVEDRDRFYAAQDKIQLQSDALAERQAETRGIDFQRLVKDAQEAGFNPLTALSFANQYSTEVGYQDRRQVWSNDTAYRQGSRDPSGPGTASAVPGSTFQPQGFTASGAGYVAPSGGSFNAGDWAATAVDAAVQTWFNRPDQADWISTQGLAAQGAAAAKAREILRSSPRNFGYALSKVEPYSPAYSVQMPDLAAPAEPAKKGVWIGGQYYPSGTGYSTADEASELFGDAVGEVTGAASFAKGWAEKNNVSTVRDFARVVDAQMTSGMDRFMRANFGKPLSERDIPRRLREYVKEIRGGLQMPAMARMPQGVNLAGF